MNNNPSSPKPGVYAKNPVSGFGRALLSAATSAHMWSSVAVLMGGQVLFGVTPAAACEETPYIASVCFTAAAFCPDDFEIARGQLLGVGQYQALYSLIGTRYGGDGSKYFALPDLQGRAPIGTGVFPSTPVSSAVTIEPGQKRGSLAVMLTSNQVGVPQHTHTATFNATTGPVTATIPATPSTLAVTSSLAMKKTMGSAVPSTDGYFLGTGGAGSTQAPIYVDPASSASTALLGGLAVTMTGAPATPAKDVTFNTVNGGTVTVGSTYIAPAAPVAIQSPVLGLTACIATGGLYPVRR